MLDTNILIDVAMNKVQFAEYSSIVVDAAEQRSFSALIDWHSISNFYYIVTSNKGKIETENFLMELLHFVEIAPTITKDALYAVTLNIKNFEDTLQVAEARACKA